ncbi:alpha/beta hydrolase [Marivirga lumbricoides]|uniref:Alpha/beta hydrolase n=2 Tax=Marivirga lumbricoides TaxID=1046115 RepID=A0ABQ1MWA5_9BACT|nr:alpha/beta hydrolase [Marivirga lumbricoides]
MESLREFQPTLVGTIPLEIDLPESDLDIICFCRNQKVFFNKVINLYGNEPAFTIYSKEFQYLPSTIATFSTSDFTIEIFGQNRPILQQSAYLHLINEFQILKNKGKDFKNAVKKLKKEGYKTEPAFAKLLGLDGNPYQALLTLPSE